LGKLLVRSNALTKFSYVCVYTLTNFLKLIDFHVSLNLQIISSLINASSVVLAVAGVVI
jgi:hypothetical protein